MLSSSPRSHPAKQWGTSRGTLPSCARVNIVACISPICDYECVTPTGNTHDHAGPCFITNVVSALGYELKSPKKVKKEKKEAQATKMSSSSCFETSDEEDQLTEKTFGPNPYPITNPHYNKELLRSMPLVNLCERNLTRVSVATKTEINAAAKTAAQD